MNLFRQILFILKSKKKIFPCAGIFHFTKNNLTAHGEHSKKESCSKEKRKI